MRPCYFIQNHLGPEQIAPLLRALERGSESFVLLGHDEFAGHASAEQVRGATGLPVFAASEPARRGYLSVLMPYFEAVGWLSSHDVDYDWLVYLSAQDYPTQPLARFERKLAASGVDGFLSYRHLDRRGFRRYGYQYYDAPGALTPVLRLLRWLSGRRTGLSIHLTYGPRVGLRRRGPFAEDWTCYIGSQWTALTRPCAEYLAERARSEQALMRWFARTVCPCESVAQTLLVNGGRFRLANDDLRYADFSGSRDGRPRTLTSRDLATITGGAHFFARKFDVRRDRRVLELLDERLA